MKKTIRVNLTNIDLARADAWAQIPAGFHVIGEEIRYDGVKKHQRVSAISSEDALKHLGPGMVVIDIATVSEPELDTEQFMAKDDDNARAIAVVMAQEIIGEGGKVHSLKQMDPGKKGLLGSGKVRYEVELAKLGIYEVGYVKSAVLELTVSNRENEPDFKKLREARDIKTLSQLLSDPEYEVKAEAFRSLNSFLSSSWVRPEEKVSIQLTLNKTAPDMGDEFMLSMIQENWNKWIAVSYLAESDDPSTLVALLQEVDDISSYSEVFCKLIERFGTSSLDQHTKHQLIETLTTTALYMGAMPHEALGSTKILIAMNEPGLKQILEGITAKKDYIYSADGNEISYSYEDQRKLARAELKRFRSATPQSVPPTAPFSKGEDTD